MSRPILIVGAGGHAKVVLDSLLVSGRRVIGLLDTDPTRRGDRVLGIEVLGGDEVLAGFPPAEVMLANGIGSTGQPAPRRAAFERLTAAGYRFPAVVHPSAVIASEVGIGDGVQVMAGCVIQPGCGLGANCIINTRAVLDHDCRIGAHAHVAPGVVLCGSVRVGISAHIGSLANVRQNIHIGDGALVAAGATVITAVRAGARVFGTPAREKGR